MTVLLRSPLQARLAVARPRRAVSALRDVPAAVDRAPPATQWMAWKCSLQGVPSGRGGGITGQVDNHRVGGRDVTGQDGCCRLRGLTGWNPLLSAMWLGRAGSAERSRVQGGDVRVGADDG